jgi:hypothetical protein
MAKGTAFDARRVGMIPKRTMPGSPVEAGPEMQRSVAWRSARSGPHPAQAAIAHSAVAREINVIAFRL